MTADAFSEDIQRCLECGMDDHLAKPIDIQVVARKLKKYLKQPGRQKEGKYENEIRSMR